VSVGAADAKSAPASSIVVTFGARSITIDWAELPWQIRSHAAEIVRATSTSMVDAAAVADGIQLAQSKIDRVGSDVSRAASLASAQERHRNIAGEIERLLDELEELTAPAKGAPRA
jgi:hypothetical protein